MRIAQSRCSQDLEITVSDNKDVVTWKRQKIKLMYFVCDVCLCVCISSIMCVQQSYREYKEGRYFGNQGDIQYYENSPYLVESQWLVKLKASGLILKEKCIKIKVWSWS